MNYVEKARRALKMTQVEFGVALGLSQPTISRLENETEELAERDRLAIRGLLAEKKVKVPE
jgi:transcriptional regulator with XRE-family HTH domain